MEESVSGYVEKIVFRNADNGYTVLNLVNDDIELTCVGIFPFINEGEYIEAKGNYIAHPLYGEQLKVVHYEVKEPEDVFSMERYLGSGAIKGVGTAMAARIVKKFKKDTFRVIEEEPERLIEIKGISERIAKEIASQFEEKKEMRNAMVFLQQYGISTNLSVKIYKQYGNRMYDIIKINPYKLADDIHGVGFKIADEIASRVGILANSDFRIQAGISHVLVKAMADGHIYLPESELISQVAELLLVEISQIENHLQEMMITKKIVVKEREKEKIIYSSSLYYMELNCARMLLDLCIDYGYTKEQLDKQIRAIEQSEEISLDERQRQAVLESARSGLLIITGGPGTGKTTTIKAIIKFFEQEGMDLLLAAPTGRAARRMRETTGHEAVTIHRLLELSGGVDEEERQLRFERNEQNPLETDLIIIDEVSMVDIHLIYALLKAVIVGTRLILVGDVNQLPSVGPGNVLRDMINSNCFPVVMLTKIFRQAAQSDIIVNAHKINRGESISFDNKSKDFFLLQRDNANVIISIVIQLINEKLPRYVNASPSEIQVLTPMRKGELGVERLNQILQRYLNPPSSEKKEKETQQGIFREGDKVMQIKNNYQLEWERRSRHGITVEVGTGVFNGDTGIIKEINLFSEIVSVEYEDHKVVEYSFAGLDELELAYAITIHKSQGSEYPAIVMPILTGPKMLLNRNLLYTAITRAKSCVTIVGKKEMIQTMIDNVSEQKRYSMLDIRIKELQES